jgi:ectoine hydroxylase-related dioxygenase (phytanoyl-CoA dioxygenase family)
MVANLITNQQKEQFQEEGYFILESVIPSSSLSILRDTCDRLVEETDAELEKEDKKSRNITHGQKRYFISNRHKDSMELKRYIFSDIMADICRATLGPSAYLFWEQFVVKGPEVGMKFGWHQDSGYVGHDHRPYLSCWATLDDVSENNGTVYILPYSRAGTKDRQEHVVEEGSNDKIGYFGDDPGIPVIAPAGSIAVFSSVSFHRSSPNISQGWRRVYLTQYSAEPILSKDGSELWGNADPILVEGKKVNFNN